MNKKLWINTRFRLQISRLKNHLYTFQTTFKTWKNAIFTSNFTATIFLLPSARLSRHRSVDSRIEFQSIFEFSEKQAIYMKMNTHDRSRVKILLTGVPGRAKRFTIDCHRKLRARTSKLPRETTIPTSAMVNYGGEARVARRINANNDQVERGIGLRWHLEDECSSDSAESDLFAQRQLGLFIDTLVPWNLLIRVPRNKYCYRYVCSYFRVSLWKYY